MQTTPVTNQTQTALLFDHMVSKRSISPEEARMLYGVRSFHRRMADLRNQGVRFRKESKRDHTGRRYVKYHFAGVTA